MTRTTPPRPEPAAAPGLGCAGEPTDRRPGHRRLGVRPGHRGLPEAGRRALRDPRGRATGSAHRGGTTTTGCTCTRPSRPRRCPGCRCRAAGRATPRATRSSSTSSATGAPSARSRIRPSGSRAWSARRRVGRPRRPTRRGGRVTSWSPPARTASRAPDVAGHGRRSGGDVLHSSEYRNGDPWKGRPVLVVGFGNSACEQAIDLVERGAQAHLSVRSAVNVVPRDVFGVVPVLQLGIVMRRLPPRVADALAWPLIRASVGDIRDVGPAQAAVRPEHPDRRATAGPAARHRHHGAHPRRSHRGARRHRRASPPTASSSPTARSWRSTPSCWRRATAPRVEEFLVLARGLRRVGGRPSASGRPTALPTACTSAGSSSRPAGMLREIGIEARRSPLDRRPRRRAAPAHADQAARRDHAAVRAPAGSRRASRHAGGSPREERPAMSTDDAARPPPTWSAPSSFSTGYEIFVGALSVLSLLNIVLITVLRDDSLRTVVYVLDALLSLIFLIDFTARISRSHGQVGLLLEAVRLGRPAGQPAAAADQDPSCLPAHPGGPPSCGTTAHAGWSPSLFRDRAGQRPAHPAAHRHPRARVRQPGDPARRAGRARREHHQRVGLAVVRHRDDVDRGLRRPVPRHEPRPRARHRRHRRRRRDLRDADRLPGEPVPVPRKDAAVRRELAEQIAQMRSLLEQQQAALDQLELSASDG